MVNSRFNCSHDVTRYVPGRTLYEIDPWTTAHFYQCGEFVAKMDLALASFNHPGRTNGQIALVASTFKFIFNIRL